MNRNTMRAEILKRTKPLKTMTIWRDHVTVILHDYIKYINGIEYRYL